MHFHSWIISPTDLFLFLQLRGITKQSPPLPDVSVSACKEIDLDFIRRDLPHQWINAVLELT